MSKRQIIITAAAEEGADDGQIADLGTRDEVYERLTHFNTYPDTPDGEFLYGPGLTIQAPVTGSDTVSQLLVVLISEDFAWPVLENIARQTGWRMMDPDSGRTLTLA